MGIGRDTRSGEGAGAGSAGATRGPAPGKTTLVGSLPVQMRREAREAREGPEGNDGEETGGVHAAAARGTSGSPTALPHLDTIQRALARMMSRG